MRTPTLVLLGLVLLASPPAGGGEKDLAQEVSDVFEEKGPLAAVAFVEAHPRPAAALAALNDVVLDTYWQKRDLRAVVVLCRSGIRYGIKRAESAEDPAAARALRTAVRAIAFSLASLAWPGRGESGIPLGPGDREVGFKAAHLCLTFAKELGEGPGALASAHWVVGAQRLAAGHPVGALKSFDRAKQQSEAAGEPLGVLLNEGYAGIAMMLEPSLLRKGRKRFAAAVAELRKVGSENALRFAGQLETARAVFAGDAEQGEKGLVTLECGPLTLRIRISDTAQLFHVVDQLSGWSRYCHRQYGRAIELTEEDEVALEVYAAIRKRKGWGGGLEQTLYTSLPVDEALFQGASEGRLTNTEVVTLQKVLARFRERVAALVARDREVLDAFVAGLDAERLTALARKLALFSGVEEIEVPVYPIVNPGDGFGGGFNGGRLTVEVPRGQDITTTFVHEVVHAFFAGHKAEIRTLAERTPGLDPETLSEAITYAFAPGIFHVEDGDPLAERVAAHLGRGEGLDDPGRYGRFRLYALALRPLLAEALEGGEETLVTFLPRARDVWLALSAVRVAPK